MGDLVRHDDTLCRAEKVLIATAIGRVRGYTPAQTGRYGCGVRLWGLMDCIVLSQHGMDV
jgi:hypothetical protein